MVDFYPERIWALEFGVASPYRVSCSTLEHERSEGVEYVIVDRLVAMQDEVDRLTKENDALRIESGRLQTKAAGAVDRARELEGNCARAEASAAVKVKALEWKEERHSECSAETIVGTYEVGFDDGWWAQLEGGVKWDWEPEFDPRSYYGSGAAKAAAQADYERRIRSALTTQPAAPDTKPSSEYHPAPEVIPNSKAGGNGGADRPDPRRS